MKKNETLKLLRGLMVSFQIVFIAAVVKSIYEPGVIIGGECDRRLTITVKDLNTIDNRITIFDLSLSPLKIFNSGGERDCK